MKNNSKGGLVLSVIIIAAIMVLGYVVISNALDTDEAKDIQNAAEQTIETVNNARDQVEATKKAAEEAAQTTSDLIDKVTP